jgi:hypothetical protein
MSCVWFGLDLFGAGWGGGNREGQPWLEHASPTQENSKQLRGFARELGVAVVVQDKTSNSCSRSGAVQIHSGAPVLAG